MAIKRIEQVSRSIGESFTNGPNDLSRLNNNHPLHATLSPQETPALFGSVDQYLKGRRDIFVGHGHVDYPWLWTMIEALKAGAATDESTLRNMELYPEMTYAKSSTFPLKWMKREHPDIFYRMQEMSRQGRVEFVGGMVIEPDCNIVGGESRARQYLYGQRFLANNFIDKNGDSVTAVIGSDLDAFGHGDTWQIDAKSGILLMPDMRPEDMENPRKQITRRRSASGHEVLGYKLAHDYNLVAGRIATHLRMSQETMRSPHDVEVIYIGAGDSGGGETRDELDEIRRLQAGPFGSKLSHGTWQEFLDTIDENLLRRLDVEYGPIEWHAPGTYSNFLELKLLNRQAEWALLGAEIAGSMASMATGRAPDHDALTEAWEDNALVGQFHDSISGTCVKDAYTQDILPMYAIALGIANRETDSALHNIAWNIKIDEEPGMIPYVIFNRNSHDLTGPVELELGGCPEYFHIVDEKDKEIPFQIIDPQGNVPWNKRVLIAPHVGAMGWNTVRVRPGEGSLNPEPMTVRFEPTVLPDDHAAYNRKGWGNLTVENGLYELSIDTTTGYIRNLYDMQDIAAAFRDEALVPAVFYDDSDTWGHGVNEFNQYAGQFYAESVDVIEQGPLRTTVEVISSYGKSKLAQRITCYKDNPRIDVKSVLDWHQQKQVLKLLFPLNVLHSKATFEGPYSIVERDQRGNELPMLEWLDASGEVRDQAKPYGVTFLGLNSAHIKTSPRGTPEIGITVVRSPEWANHYPNKNNSTDPQNHMDQGRHKYTISFIPHSGGFFRAESDRHAAELNAPFVAQRITYRPNGTLSQTDSLISVGPNNLRVNVLKQAEDGKGKVMRVRETVGIGTRGTVELPKLGRHIKIDLAPTEIKTIYIPNNSNEVWYEVDIPELKRVKSHSGKLVEPHSKQL